ELEVSVADDLPMVRAVPGRIWQIAYALVVNAIEAITAQPRGLHRVGLDARLVGRRIEIRVEDTGCGIDPAHLPQIFEPFFTTRKGRQRAGLGLTLVWRYVD